MSNSTGNFLSALLRVLLSIFKKSPKPPAPPVTPTVPPDSTTEPAQVVTRRVLVVTYDPVMDEEGTTLSQSQGWNRVETLITAFSADILQASGGMARYEIVERVERDAFPPKTDGFRYTPATYLDVLRGVSPPHTPQGVDYHYILDGLNILQRVTDGEIDEVWVFAFPYAGFYESVMAGKGAFWCNAPPLSDTAQCPRRFVIMGFNYERGVGEMLEAFGHRAESIMEQTFRRLQGEANLWKRFTRYDKIAPGKAAVGTIHFAPNSEHDYDWNNPRLVPSECDDWLHNFPNFQGEIRQVNADEWGNGDMRAHHLWWLEHLPKVAGRINGIHNNWWQYIMDPQRVIP